MAIDKSNKETMVNVLITGGAGYLGNMVTQLLSEQKDGLSLGQVICTDIRKPDSIPSNITFEYLDITKDDPKEYFHKYNISCVIHLASIVNPGKNSTRELEYEVDVNGTKKILKACVESNVERIIVSSSGAAYGYHPENLNVLTESSQIRGNQEFAYSYHKRLVEEELKIYQSQYPELKQFIFRISTILGEKVNNQITDLFKKPVQFGIWGTDSRFSLIWDIDAAQAFIKAITSPKPGIYNLSGDGSVSIQERSKILKKPMLLLPAKVIEFALWFLKKLKLTQYGPEQTMFIKYRPVLDNTKLKEDFEFTPQKTSLENFQDFANRL